MQKDPVKLTEEFVKRSFQKYPHFSYNDWRVMHNHSKKVAQLALKISQNLKADKELLAIGALLHDIGKTHKASEKVLHHHHEDFNLKQSKPLLDSLGIDRARRNKLENIITHKSRGIEQKIIKDADAIALYADKRLYTLFIKWAYKKKLYKAIQRKLDKFKKLNFPISKKLGTGWLARMEKDWNKILKS